MPNQDIPLLDTILNRIDAMETRQREERATQGTHFVEELRLLRVDNHEEHRANRKENRWLMLIVVAAILAATGVNVAFNPTTGEVQFSDADMDADGLGAASPPGAALAMPVSDPDPIPPSTDPAGADHFADNPLPEPQ